LSVKGKSYTILAIDKILKKPSQFKRPPPSIRKMLVVHPFKLKRSILESDHSLANNTDTEAKLEKL